MRGDARTVGVALALSALALGGAARAHEGDSARLGPRPIDPAAVDPGAGAPSEPPSPSRAPDLFDPLELARAAGWMLEPAPSASAREERAEAGLEERLDTDVMEDRRASGDVDGWYYESGRQMRRRFRPSPQRFESERTASMDPLAAGADYLGALSGGPEVPIDVPGQPPPELRPRFGDPTDRSDMWSQERFEWCNPVNAPVRWYGVVVRVTFNPEGETIAAWVERSSGYRALDEAALEAVRGGPAEAPPPPHVVGERQAVQADWLFEVGIVHHYLGCEASCVEDPDLGTLCGRDIVRRRMRLLRVVDAAHQTPRERRAGRRRDPERTRP